MNAIKHPSWCTNLRIVWTITYKDILEALKNKNAVSVVITASLLAIAYSFIPALTALDNMTNVLVYDAASSSLGAQLKASQALEVYTYPTEAIMLTKLSRGEVPELGLVIPADFDRAQAESNGSPKEPDMTGYVLYWVSDAEIARLVQEVEAEVTRLAGRPVHIRVADQRVIPEPSQGSLGNWVGVALIFMVIYISLGLIPNLMLEEKQTHTLEALLVSPASSWHVVVGKALTGLFYCLLGTAVMLAINYKLLLHGWLLIPVVLIGALFSISLGLIAGSLVEERGQLSLWTFGLLLPLFVSVILSTMDDLLPRWLNQVIILIPSATFFQLLQASISVMPPASTLLAQFAWLTAWAVAGLACAVWLLRRQEHKDAGDQGISTRQLDVDIHREELPSTAPREEPAVPVSANTIHLTVLGMQPVRPASGWSIVRAIAIKDIRQSIRNKMILSILLGSLILVVGNAVLLRMLSAHAGSTASLAASSSPVLAIMISVVLMALGVALVPLLMVEEKEDHTLEALLVSPARYLQVVAGKALAGSVYCLSGVVVILIAYYFLFLHWELALLAMLLGTAFVVALGLFVGVISNNPTTIGMWAAATLIILIIPAVLAGLGSLAQVSWAAALAAYWPSTAIVNLFYLAMVAEIPQGAVMGNVSVLIGAAVILYGLTWWVVRRSDRQS